MSRHLTSRQDLLSFLSRSSSGYVPCHAVVYPTVWDADPSYFEAVQSEAPHVEITVSRDPEREHESTRTDAWGCGWRYPGLYLDGQVVEHPLPSWESSYDFQVPDPMDYVDWDREAQDITQLNRRGEAAWGHVEHGFLYLRLTYLRGFCNFMLDIAERRTELYRLRDAVVGYWCDVVQKWIDLGVDGISFGDDLGHQNALPMSPEVWRTFLKPAFRQVFDICSRNDVIVSLHTDGYIVDIIDDLIEIGVDILNPQDLVNGVQTLRKRAWGRVCIDLDIDRQKITVFGSVDDVDRHILRCVRLLGSADGGLMLKYGAYPGTPKENVVQVIRSMEAYWDLWVR